MATRPSNRTRNRWTVDLLDLKPEHHILEIGCGPGVALKECLEQVETGLVTGLDHSAVMLDQAAYLNRKAVEWGQLILQEGTLECCPLPDGSYDRIFSVNVAQFFADRDLAFFRIFCLLKPGGIAAATFMPRMGKMDREQALAMAEKFETAMRKAGFGEIHIEELPLKPVPVICVLGKRV